jgi:hypothetical protein
MQGIFQIWSNVTQVSNVAYGHVASIRNHTGDYDYVKYNFLFRPEICHPGREGDAV